jgi:molybdopterin-guanine dinucleotide biosynthesis protein A
VAEHVGPANITGVVLAGGRGARMGGIDKGLQDFNGTPLALNALRRLAPQVNEVVINANRNLEAYRAFGVPVFADDAPDDYAGPLAGFLAALTHCKTPWLATVPCDSPMFPEDLVQRLANGLQASAAVGAESDIAVAAAPEDGTLRLQPVFCLMRVTLRDSLAQFLSEGGHKVGAWLAQQKTLRVAFDAQDHARAFANVNTLDELKAWTGP